MNKKIIILIAVLVGVGLVLYLIFLTRPAKAPEETGVDKSATTPTPATQLPTSSGLVAVDIKGFAFVGKTTTINAGTKIIWKNFDAAPHTVTSDTGLFDSQTLLKNQSFSYTFNIPGVYKYHCSIHPEVTGEIFVK